MAPSMTAFHTAWFLFFCQRLCSARETTGTLLLSAGKDRVSSTNLKNLRRLAFSGSSDERRGQVKSIRRTDQYAQAAAYTVERPRQPGQRTGHFQTIGGA